MTFESLFNCLTNPRAFLAAKQVVDRFQGKPLVDFKGANRAELLPQPRLNVFWMHASETHVTNSVVSSDNTDNTNYRMYQGVKPEAVGVRARILEALDGRPQDWLAEKAGIKPQTLSDYLTKGIAKADAAVRIARALGVDLEWLLTGAMRSKDELDARKASSAHNLEQTQILAMFASLSARERDAIFTMLCMLTGNATDLVGQNDLVSRGRAQSVFVEGGSNVHDAAPPFRGESD